MPAFFILILLFVVMYAAMIRPQQKRAREHQALIAAVQLGDEVMTTAGIFGTVTAVEGDVISVEISPGVVMRVARAAIGRRLTGELEEYEAGETFDDVDDELGESVADDAGTAVTSEPALSGDGATTPTPTPTPPPAPAPPPAPEPPSVSPQPPVTPPAQTPPMPPGTGPATPGPGPGSAEPG